MKPTELDAYEIRLTFTPAPTLDDGEPNLPDGDDWELIAISAQGGDDDGYPSGLWMVFRRVKLNRG